jgi:mannosyltransferase OCH1-like enzyme
MITIPKIIHQIWSGIDEPLPKHFEILGETWKEHYPDWQYEFWDNKRMIDFVWKYYPQNWDIYNSFPYNIQRWDVIRYLILYKMGGMYVDFDYESIKPMDELLNGKTCCFALEPEYQYWFFNKNIMFNNALMLSVPKHPFMLQIIERSLSKENLSYAKIPKNECVLNTTGPYMLIDLYENLNQEEKEAIYLIPAKYVTPFDGYQARSAIYGIENEDLERCLDHAYAVHYFFTAWQ